MPDFVFDIPAQRLAIYFSLIAVFSVFLGLLVVKPVLRLLIGTGPNFNETIGQATAGFSLFYGLLLGLLTVAAYQNNDRVREGIVAEASALGALYADMKSYPEPLSSQMQEMLRDYVLFTIHDDWPAHRRGEVLNGGFNRTNAMRQRLASFEPATTGQEALHTEVISSFQSFSLSRQQRLTGVTTRIPDVLWYAVLVGAAVNVILLVMLKARARQHFLLATISAFFLGVILFVIVALDRPMRGEAGLSPEPLQLLWDRAMTWDEARR